MELFSIRIQRTFQLVSTPQGKLPRKECGKCGWQDRFDFPLMEGETVLYIIIQSFQTCSLVIPYMPIFL
jgi:hypothetical protein